MNWIYGESDAGLMLFTAALERFQMDFKPGSKILELGCAETDWLERMARADASFDLTGVDARPEQPRDHVLIGDACNPDLFEQNTFDWVVMLGALEHFGLGYYGDPKHLTDDNDCNGDTLTMQNVARWLKPSGFVYFDVPCNPTGCITPNRHYRVYSPAEVELRLIAPSFYLNHYDASGPLGYHNGVPCTVIMPGLTEIARAYSLPEPDAGTWTYEPTSERVPYWYVAVLAQKQTPETRWMNAWRRAVGQSQIIEP